MLAIPGRGEAVAIRVLDRGVTAARAGRDQMGRPTDSLEEVRAWSGYTGAPTVVLILGDQVVPAVEEDVRSVSRVAQERLDRVDGPRPGGRAGRHERHDALEALIDVVAVLEEDVPPIV